MNAFMLPHLKRENSFCFYLSYQIWHLCSGFIPEPKGQSKSREK